MILPLPYVCCYPHPLETCKDCLICTASIRPVRDEVPAVQDVVAKAAAGAQAAMENSQATAKASATIAADLAATQATVKHLQADLAAATDAAAEAAARAAAAEADLGESLLALGMNDEVQVALAAAVDALGGDGAAIVHEMEARHTADALAGQAAQASDVAVSHGVSTSGVSVASTDWGSDVSAVMRSAVGDWAAGADLPAGDPAAESTSVFECQEEVAAAVSPHVWSPADCREVSGTAEGGDVSSVEGVGYAGYPCACEGAATPALEKVPGVQAAPAGSAPAVGVVPKAAVGSGCGGGRALLSPRSPLAPAPFTPRRRTGERAAAHAPEPCGWHGAVGVASGGDVMV